MVVRARVPGGAGSNSLSVLATDVRRARQNVLARRMAPVVWEDLVRAQRTLLRAMEAYVSELVLRRLPIPHRLRDDLRLQRELWGGVHRASDDRQSGPTASRRR